ncbi:MAG: hypothetical protein ABW046_22530 [Actinoplanes sp.]
MATRPTYASREHVMQRGDIQATAYMARQVDEALQAQSRILEDKCQRPGGLFPSLRTLYLDWPDMDQSTASWRLWIGPDELISVTSLTSGGTAITGTLLESNLSGPPYAQLQLNRAGSSYLGGGSTPQRSLVLVGWTGYRDDQAPAGTLASAIGTTSATTMTVSDGSLVGVGDQLIIESERVVVTDRSMVTTSQTLSADLAAQASAVAATVSSGAAFGVGETILIDSERMRIIDIAGNVLTVKRQWDGSVLAAHTSTAVIYSPRQLTVERAAQGTTAATHAQGTAVYRWKPPPAAQALAAAEVLNQLQQESAAYARQVGSGEFAREVGARGLKDLRDQVYKTPLRRRARSWAV